MEKEHYDVLIVGTGAAGLAAALYAGRYNLDVLVVGEEFGGETTTAGVIHNYPGAKDIDGYDLMKIMKEQATGVGSEVIDGRVESIENNDGCFFAQIGDKKITASTVILATGTSRRRLGLPNEESLKGKGVHYCMTCDGPLYGGKTVAVVGGGDGAIKGANLSAQYADKIYIIVRGDKLRAEPINQEELESYGDKIEVLYQTEVKEIVGGEKLEKVVLTKEHNGSNELVLDGLFIEIGAVPDTTLAKGLGVELDEYGSIKSDNMMATNVPGVYVAGDATNIFGSFKQDITAACTGSVAATSAYAYKKKHGDVCRKHWVPIKHETHA